MNTRREHRWIVPVIAWMILAVSIGFILVAVLLGGCATPKPPHYVCYSYDATAYQGYGNYQVWCMPTHLPVAK